MHINVLLKTFSFAENDTIYSYGYGARIYSEEKAKVSVTCCIGYIQYIITSYNPLITVLRCQSISIICFIGIQVCICVITTTSANGCMEFDFFIHGAIYEFSGSYDYGI